MASAGSSRFQQFLRSETGPRTIHFWAPVMKWALVFAGISDFNRPAEKISGTQQMALAATGMIWTRWCMIIKPRNILLASVNFFLGAVALTQLGRVYNYQTSLGNDFSTSVKNIISGKTGAECSPIAAQALKVQQAIESAPVSK
ncbi:UPF0041-domain-containing protein [Nadsonia fulvescens var. elongata DSM 6958]|uniref:Mitochondrial pyruvate carrier n=1 Tax=Nadsonia fulvescens var. elongata DSM 6958 TaxID=857566 RepID=A0A1E3PKS7_9ASCO|nr:UPF0041-domain-containing protein [Nadsonia fulvescens var. elongata DSM 6958]